MHLLQYPSIRFYNPNIKEHSFIAFLFGLATFLELWFYQPWDTFSYQDQNKYYFLAGYGIIASACYFLTYIVPKLFIKSAIKWSLITEFSVLVLFILLLSLSTLFYHHIYFEYKNYSLSTITTWTSSTFQLGFLLFTLLLYWKWQKNKNSSLIKTVDDSPQNKIVELKGVNKNETLQLRISEIVYFKSDRNYIELYYYKKDKISCKLFRNTLSKVEEQISADFFHRIHKSYIVNQLYIEKLFTSNGAYFLQLKQDQIQLPVSRKNIDSVKEMVNKLNVFRP